MLLHGKIASSAANGPGDRAVVWFQGCTLNCAGCQNPVSHSFQAPQTDIKAVADWLLNLQGIEGVTFSGGEPLQHYYDLLALCRSVRVHRPEWSIGIFTGYTLRELEQGAWQHWQGSSFARGSGELWANFRALIDFAACGRYNPARQSSALPLCGSANQTLELLSERYQPEDFPSQTIEVRITEGLVQLTGFPGSDFQ